MDIEYVDSPPDSNEPIEIDYNQMPISCEPKQPLREDLLFYRNQRFHELFELDQKFIVRNQPIRKVQPTIGTRGSMGSPIPIKPIKNKKRKAAEMELFATHDEFLEHQ
jgi:hypothetical protein